MRKLGVAFCVGGVAICAYCGGRVAFVGDSITHDGRYLAYLQLMEQFDHPDDPDVYFNAGVSGDTAFDGRNRWSDDVLQMKPTSVFVMMGMNDVKRELWQRVSPTDDVEARNRQTALDSCCTNLAALCALAKRDVGNVTLMTPTPYDSYGAYETANLTGCNEPQGLSVVAEFVRLLANREHVGLVELHRPITAVLRENSELKLWGTDRVHPQNEGHLLMAALIRSAMVGTGDVSRVAVDAGGREDLTFGYCPKRLPFPNVREVKAVDAVYPFTENFNREILIVRNLPIGNYELLSEGKHLAEFSAAQLAAGVNLSGMDTPNAARARDAYDRMMRYRGWINTCRRLAVARKLIRKAGGDPSNYKEALKCADVWCAAHKDEPWFPASGAAIEVWKKREPLKDDDAKEGVRLLREALSVCRPIAFDITIRKTERHSFGTGTNDLARFAVRTLRMAEYVDPMIGTVGNGHAFPGPCRPFGMVQPSPDTGNGSWKYCSGYSGEDHVIRRFSQTHLNGTGQAGLGDVGLLPFVGEMPLDASELCVSFKKGNERAVLGKYEVRLDDGVRVEIAAGCRLAHYRITFPGRAKGKVLLDFPYGLYRQKDYLPLLTTSCRVERVSASRLEGTNHSEVFAPRDIFYVIGLDPEPSRIYELPRQLVDKGPRYIAEFSAGGAVEVKIALSSRSLAGARRNFEAEETTGFDRRVKETVEEWNGYLSRISLDGWKDEEMKSLATALYHLFIQPNIISDADEKPRYSTFSLWDTFRDAHPLYEKLVPELVVPFVESLLDHYDRWGYLPRWELWGRETNCMIGSHAVPVIGSAYRHGFRGFDVEKAYAAVKATLTSEERPGAGKVYPRRTEWAVYNQYGYFPFDLVHHESVSRTLECSFDDFCAFQFARDLGKTGDAAFFEKRSWNFTNLFDRTTLCFRGRDSYGRWREPFDPANTMATPDYTEGSALQYSWHVLHRPEWLVEKMGGPKAFEARLDAFFAGTLYPESHREYTQDITGLIGDYAHGNEPCHHIPDMYRIIGRGEKMQSIVRRIMKEFYVPKSDGLCGNDDCGQMSAWYLFSAAKWGSND